MPRPLNLRAFLAWVFSSEDEDAQRLTDAELARRLLDTPAALPSGYDALLTEAARRLNGGTLPEAES